MAGDDERPKESEAVAGDVVTEIADARILQAAERRAQERLVHEYDVPLRIREPKLYIDPAGWRTGFLAVRERDDFPTEMMNDLHELTPQSILRDLYRPVMESVWHEREPRFAMDEGGRRALAEARAQAVRRERAPHIEPTARAVKEEMVRRRDFYAQRWQAAKPDDAPRDTRRTSMPDFDATDD